MTDDGTDDTTTRLREHLRAALENAEHRGTRRRLREALQLVDAIDGAAAGGPARDDAHPGAGAAEVPTESDEEGSL